MKYESILARDRAGGLWLKESRGRARRVCAVAHACSALKRSRRQVYRHMASGTLATAGKFLGEWLLELDSVERLARRPPSVQRLPRALRRLFPEYDVAALNAGRDRTLILARVLDGGSWTDLRWLSKRYAPEEIARFIEKDGARLLSPRSARLWSLCFNVTPAPLPAWRKNPWP